MKNDLKYLSQELLKKINSLEGFNPPLIEEELVRKLAEELDEISYKDKQERIRAMHNMFALGQIFNNKDSEKS